MIFPIPLIGTFCIIIILNLQQIATQIDKFVIFEENNNYPRATLLSNNYLMLTSGMFPTRIKIYTDTGELKLSDSFLEYNENANIIQLKNGNLLLVSGGGRTNKISLILFDENLKCQTFETDYYSDLYRTTLLPLSNGNVLVGMGYYNVTHLAESTVFAVIYSIDGNLGIKEQYNASWHSDNKFLSCQEMDSNKAIICQYIKDQCDESYIIFDAQLKETNRDSVYKYQHCGFDNLLKMDSDILAFTYFFYTTMYIKVYQHDNYQLTVII